jgi:uncharacterized membrane protein
MELLSVVLVTVSVVLVVVVLMVLVVVVVMRPLYDSNLTLLHRTASTSVLSVVSPVWRRPHGPRRSGRPRQTQ